MLSDNHDIISMKLYQLMVEHTPEEENQDWSKIEPSVSLLKSPKGTTVFSHILIHYVTFHSILLEVFFQLYWNLIYAHDVLPLHEVSTGSELNSLLYRQHWRPHWKLPRHAADRMEGLPASAVCSARNCGVWRSGSCSFPQKTGKEQEVLLRREWDEEDKEDEFAVDWTVSRQQIEHIQCEFFSKDCIKCL